MSKISGLIGSIITIYLAVLVKKSTKCSFYRGIRAYHILLQKIVLLVILHNRQLELPNRFQ